MKNKNPKSKALDKARGAKKKVWGDAKYLKAGKTISDSPMGRDHS